MPSGFTLDASTGVISGTPTATGTSDFTVKVTDSGGYTATQSLSITVAASHFNEGSSNHNNGGSGGSITSTGTSTTTNTNTSTNTSTAPDLPTVVTSHVFSSDGGTIQQSQGNMTVHVNVPQGAFAEPETMTVTAATPTDLTHWVSGLSKSSVAVVLGVNFSGTTPTKSVTGTITDPSIMANAEIYKLTTGGGLVPMKASVSMGKAVVSFTSDPDFVVLNVKKDQRVITLTGHASIVPGLVQTDPANGNKTTYMPIWYVMQMLKTLNISSTWDGHNWKLTTENQPTLGTVQLGKGTMHLYLDGKLVQNVTGVYAKDPSTGKNTTYMPIWYVMQVLNKVSIGSVWNGTTWSLTKPAAQNGNSGTTK